MRSIFSRLCMSCSRTSFLTYLQGPAVSLGLPAASPLPHPSIDSGRGHRSHFSRTSLREYKYTCTNLSHIVWEGVCLLNHQSLASKALSCHRGVPAMKNHSLSHESLTTFKGFVRASLLARTSSAHARFGHSGILDNDNLAT